MSTQRSKKDRDGKHRSHVNKMSRYQRSDRYQDRLIENLKRIAERLGLADKVQP